MASNSEARKAHQLEVERRERIEAFARTQERRREVAQAALERIMDGASLDDADALLLAIEDCGGALVVPV